MEVRQHQERYNITLDAGESIEIKINGNSVKTLTVAAGKSAQVSFSFDEEVIQV